MQMHMKRRRRRATASSPAVDAQHPASTAAPTRPSGWSPRTTRASSSPRPTDSPTLPLRRRRAYSPTSRPAGPSAATAACSRASPSRSRSTRLAERSGIDPIELRRRNFIGEYGADRQRPCGSPPTASPSAWTRWSGAPAGRSAAASSASGAASASRGSHVHQRHQLPHLPERDAAERGAAQAGPLRPGHRVLRRRATSARASNSLLAVHRRRGAGLDLARRARGGGGHRSHARWTWAPTRRAAPS